MGTYCKAMATFPWYLGVYIKEETATGREAWVGVHLGSSVRGIGIAPGRHRMAQEVTECLENPAILMGDSTVVS